MRLVPAAVLVILTTSRGLAAEPAVAPAPDRSSHYLPPAHWAHRYLDLLSARGVVGDLQPLVRPWRRIDVAASLLNAKAAGRLRESEEAWADLVLDELEAEVAVLTPPAAVPGSGAGPAGRARGEARGEARGSAGARVLASSHRDVLRPNRTDDVFFFLEVDLAADFPNATSRLRFRWDDWLLDDPQFPDGRVVEHHPNFLGLGEFGGRAEEAYLEAQLPYLRFLFGRLHRNWGLAGSQGFLVSDYAYSYDQVGYRVGNDRLSVTGFSVQLDEFEPDIKRWHSAHRLDWRVSDRLALAAGEAVVYGGPNRSLDWRMTTPIGIWLVGGYGEDYVAGPNQNNSFSQVEAWWKPSGGSLLYATFMLDDWGHGTSPPGYALALSLSLPSLGPRLGLRIDYSQVSAFAYRAPAPHERYSFRELGLGRDMSDHDRLDVLVSWLPRPRLLLEPRVTLLRRGEGDFRDPWPAEGSAGMPWLFLGEVETTLRLALGGHWVGKRIRAEWDLGGNLVRDHDHVPGATREEFVGRIALTLSGSARGSL